MFIEANGGVIPIHWVGRRPYVLKAAVAVAANEIPSEVVKRIRRENYNKGMGFNESGIVYKTQNWLEMRAIAAAYQYSYQDERQQLAKACLSYLVQHGCLEVPLSNTERQLLNDDVSSEQQELEMALFKLLGKKYGLT